MSDPKEDVVVQGAFIASLKRNNKQIREDRADAISDDAKRLYKRTIEDEEDRLKKLKREQENMLDLSGDNALSTKPAIDFDPKVYVDVDIALGIKIRECEIKLEIAQKRYAYLFGGN
jgi:hypothetical protein